MATNTLDSLTTAMYAKPIVSERHSSIKITHRPDRTLYTHIIQLITRPIRNFLGRPKKHHPHGSIKLKPDKIIKRSCTYSERTVCDINIYDLFPKKLAGHQVEKRIYYFCGGGWQSPPSAQHWQICAKLARSMPETSVSVVSYPLAPNNAAPTAFPMLMRLYRTLLAEAVEERHRVILAGDSAGGNIVLSLVLEALAEDEAEVDKSGSEQEKIPQPVAIMAICPSTDLTRSNPEIEKLKRFDPILTPDFVKSTAKAWQGDWDPSDRKLSPINADISLLAKRGIRVHGITGGYDILGPDAIKFRDMCVDERVQGEWLQWEKQMHCFVLTWPYGVHEGREAIGWVIDVLKKE